ncbi:PREDICTED: uncharacterized protein LOC100634840 isoform X1 [Amphimedon queenslandica]|uniref:Enoyl reductase (ER) domain-containing protein n=1 Tax=Amphimedon queenslandica TaxID=400682 RepID=A0A1X7VWT3_AMPQE|nr:PREDICTED: uncharacterized protein LOC100634840 isoform X1 [Amphimedon queenslandica]|eukprot:XP_003382380.1 PREDICTED: uncharacterized protein LOC100634840 isoform X1 [Amphimedon queenslandica]
MATLPKFMKALVKESPTESYLYKDVPVPQPSKDELLVKVKKVALCGTDIQKYKWNYVAKVVAEIPFTPGHEMVGEIVSVGKDVPCEYALGKRVCVENHFYCGKCYQCTHDLKHICQNLDQFGYGKGTKHGGCSEYTIIPAKFAYLLQTDIDDAQAAILEPCGVAHQAVESIEPDGEDVLVLGCGPVGLLAVGIAKALGASKVYACDMFPEKLQLAKEVGADVLINNATDDLNSTIMEKTGGNGIGRIIEATGSTELAGSCFKYLRKGGQICFVGLIKGALDIENPLVNVVFKSLVLKTVHGRRIFEDWEKSEQLIHKKMINTKPIITHEFPMSQFEEAFETLLCGKGCKVLISPRS